MHSLDTRVMHQALTWITHQPVWLCTVIRTFGSSPRAPGALLVANGQGAVCGSLSGGCVEEDFLRRLVAGEFRQHSQMIRYGEGGLATDRPLPCGGALDVLIEYLPPDEKSAAYLQSMAAVLEGRGALTREVRLPERCHALTSTPGSTTSVSVEGALLTLSMAAPPTVIIAGLSAVALCCSDFATALGFNTLVVENRPEVLADYQHQLGPEVQLIRQFPAKFIENSPSLRHCAVVCLTHDPRVDDLTLMEAIETDAFYIGAIGSQRNSARRRQRLQEIAGLTEAQLTRIHAPVGLAIGSKTPAEIALAVMADIVRLKNGGKDLPPSENAA